MFKLNEFVISIIRIAEQKPISMPIKPFILSFILEPKNTVQNTNATHIKDAPLTNSLPISASITQRIVAITAIFNGFFEITSGLVNLSVLNIPYNVKLILTIIYLAFGGISIHMQIKSILKDTVSYKLFYLTRVFSIIISLILLICIT